MDAKSKEENHRGHEFIAQVQPFGEYGYLLGEGYDNDWPNDIHRMGARTENEHEAVVTIVWISK